MSHARFHSPSSLLPSCIHMDKYTVQDRVKVQPVHKDAAGHKPAGQKVRLVKCNDNRLSLPSAVKSGTKFKELKAHP